jgi:hypothetical protein
MFELQIQDAPPGLAALGRWVELHELPYGELRAVMRTTARDLAGEGLLGACLFVDGAPIGLEALLALPGRFSGAIAAAMGRAMALHGMVTEEADDDSDSDEDDGDTDPGNDGAPGEPRDGEPRQGEP